MPIKDGKQYVERLDASKASVWIQGNKVTVPVSSHPAFAGLISTQAELYDMQGQSTFQQSMTYKSPTTGDPVGMSFLIPKSKADLKKRRIMFGRWADIHHGFLGRSPDYMNTTMMAFGAAAELLSEHNPSYTANMKAYYEYCRENDITLSHAFILPHKARLRTLLKTHELPDAPTVVEKTKEGLIVNGAFLLATQGVTAEEILVYPTPLPSPHIENPYAFGFAIPNNLPGVKFICRESFVSGTSRYDYPLSSRFEEMDTLVVLDHVLIPHDRVFMYGDARIMAHFFEKSHFHTHAGHQVLCRVIAKTEFLLGTIELMIDTLGLRTYNQVIEKVAEVIATLESLKGLLIACEANARLDQWGSMLPDSRPLYAANYLFPKLFPQMMEIVQLLGASSIIMIPNEQDFASEAAGDINRYLRGINLDAKQNVGLFRLVWELSTSSFAGRQCLYERFFFGDAIKVANRLYHGYANKDAYAAKVSNFLSDSITKN
ncbi:4-hydroxyphenylacetate 3-monooxygenase, oxygenase component [Paenibacillus agilis]|uniref:4-hydroxyphenylacetate 3-monooxygenase, oxygenase component n=1 Tax=Paenibacillus agilis TaxID=3020863 RepID=A0A559IGT3_9BACL|nr:4-hydroxyphenylacetate 3-monooxygenase, oxygenase component [Paenibacillus agilis]TVX86879.1 4-hydroxyphenylacetate 3-monooxygenase, oxygenase component [Paenibacillus agilis]